MNTYVRVDQTNRYIYFLNDTSLYHNTKGEMVYRSKYLLRAGGRFQCIRMKFLSKLPVDKKVNVWYNKVKRGEKGTDVKDVEEVTGLRCGGIFDNFNEIEIEQELPWVNLVEEIAPDEDYGEIEDAYESHNESEEKEK